MIDYTLRDVEFTVMGALDECLMKIAEDLEDHFDPKEDKYVNLLKLFRSMIETRLKWTRAYRLITLPEPEAVSLTSKKFPDTRLEKGKAAIALPAAPKYNSETAIEEVVKALSKKKVEPPAVPVGLLRQ